MGPILIFFVAHWMLSIFAQTFFLHRYGAHRMFTMSPGWERFFYLFSYATQGPSFLVPRAYAILHREHHAFTDTPDDPHSPRFSSGLASMMWRTKQRYDAYAYRTCAPEARFDGGVPEWPLIDRVAQTWVSRIGLGALYVLFYLHFAPSAGWFLLLPVHWLMGPIHSAIVNWCGHRYGYRNFALDDDSRNTLPLDFVTMGDLFQNNHHKYGARANFAVRRFEVDPCYQVIRLLAWAKIVELTKGAAMDKEFLAAA